MIFFMFSLPFHFIMNLSFRLFQPPQRLLTDDHPILRRKDLRKVVGEEDLRRGGEFLISLPEDEAQEKIRQVFQLKADAAAGNRLSADPLAGRPEGRWTHTVCTGQPGNTPAPERCLVDAPPRHFAVGEKAGMHRGSFFPPADNA